MDGLADGEHVNIIKLQYKKGYSAVSTFRAQRAYNLTHLNFFLLDYVKDRVYLNNLQNLDQLKTNIREVLEDMCRKVKEIHLKRIEAGKRFSGGYLTDI